MSNDSLKCLRCHTPMQYIGKKQFREGTNWGILGDIGELFESSQAFDLFACPRCRKVEFFMEDTGDEIDFLSEDRP